MIYGIIRSSGNILIHGLNFMSYFFLIFTIAWFLPCIIETLYVSIVLQIYLRFKRIENFLKANEENFQHKDVINEILMKTTTLIEVINKVFGISILIIAGESYLFNKN
jgi:hypothetical protein